MTRGLEPRQRRIDRPADAVAGAVDAPPAPIKVEPTSRMNEGSKSQKLRCSSAEGHVGRADHQRHHPVAEPAKVAGMTRKTP